MQRGGKRKTPGQDDRSNRINRIRRQILGVLSSYRPARPVVLSYSPIAAAMSVLEKSSPLNSSGLFNVDASA